MFVLEEKALSARRAQAISAVRSSRIGIIKAHGGSSLVDVESQTVIAGSKL
jgi:hypothetical protein